ncbi:unnamed protein product [Umbelopsis vinacea]
MQPPQQPGVLKLGQWNAGLFANEFLHRDLIGGPPATGTFHGSQLAAMEMFTRIENRFRSYFDVARFEPTVPENMNLPQQQQLFTFQRRGDDRYPPHLDMIPNAIQVNLLNIFQLNRLANVGVLLGHVIPETILDFVFGHPNGNNIAQIEILNRARRAQQVGIYAEPNIGDRQDWYSDAVFAQQQLTGVNPTTIELASDSWRNSFRDEADRQTCTAMSHLITANAASNRLYIQDNSYFRGAIGAAPDAALNSGDRQLFGCAAVSLFQLHENGKLHPLAIVIDFKGSMDNSVVIFNNRLTPDVSTTSEATDWPWRYAKMCAQVSDWTRHELTVHLVNAHFVEEVAIVAVQRAFPNNHIVYRLLEPHWSKTLSLNASARSALVPEVIARVVGYTEDQLYNYINDAYTRFDWQNLYVPRDLERRGFPPGELNAQRFQNYAYGKNVSDMWNAIRTFVSSVIISELTDQQVATDQYIQDWSNGMRRRDGGNMQSFPVITNMGELINAVVMCIHIAAPQHTAVNYLQQYYQSFVINKPPCLCAPLPATTKALMAYQEPDLIRALPVNHPRVWLLSEYLPYLLNSRVAADQSLVNYATSLVVLSQQRGEPAIAAAATTFLNELQRLDNVFAQNNHDLGPNNIPYLVMNPSNTANSIII